MLTSLAKLLFGGKEDYAVQTLGKFKEDPSLAEKRKKALDRMHEQGRKSMLEGGDFKFETTVL